MTIHSDKNVSSQNPKTRTANQRRVSNTSDPSSALLMNPIDIYSPNTLKLYYSTSPAICCPLFFHLAHMQDSSSFQLLALAAITLATVLWFISVRSSSGNRSRLPPGPRGLPLLGNLLQIPGKVCFDTVHLRLLTSPASRNVLQTVMRRVWGAGIAEFGWFCKCFWLSHIHCHLHGTRSASSSSETWL